MHPSNVHDNAYAFGAIDFTGDMPVIWGPDGPSLGGFVCPAAVIEADRWKLGQLSAGETVRLRAVTESEARSIARARQRALAGDSGGAVDQPVRARHHVERSVIADIGDVRARRAGDGFMLVEFGPNILDLALRLRVEALRSAIVADDVGGIVEMTPGIRSLLIRYDPAQWSGHGLAARLRPLFESVRDVAATRVPSRIVHLPLSWDDPACRAAIDRYVQSVRADAPWCPDNIEFIRRINGLADAQAVKDIVFGADYLVMGLGDVYLGAPVATPVDPRHRLVTTPNTTRRAPGRRRIRWASGEPTCASTVCKALAGISSSAARCRSGTKSGAVPRSTNIGCCVRSTASGSTKLTIVNSRRCARRFPAAVSN